MDIKYPKIYPDLDVYTIKPIVGKEKRVLGSKISDRTLQISEKIEKPLKELLPSFDGINTTDDISEIARGKNIRIDIKKFVTVLAENGLLENIEGKCLNEVKIVGSPFLKYKFKRNISKKLVSLCKIITRSYFFILIGLTIISIYLLLTNKVEIRLEYIRQSGLYAILLSYIFGIFHEISHMIYAISNGIEIDSLEVRLNFGIMPIVFIKYKGLYFIKAEKRLNLILSGIYFHIFMVLVSLIILSIKNSIFIKAILVCNIFKIVVNTCPYQITDGYYALCTIMGKYNIRINTLKALLKPSKNIDWKRFLLGAVYSILTVSTIVMYLIGTYEISMSVENIIGINNKIVYVAALIFYMYQWKWIFRKLKKYVE